MATLSFPNKWVAAKIPQKHAVRRRLRKTAERRRPLQRRQKTQHFERARLAAEILGQQNEERVDDVGLVANAHEIEIDAIVQKPEREPGGPRVDRAHEHDDNDLGLRTASKRGMRPTWESTRRMRDVILVSSSQNKIQTNVAETRPEIATCFL